MQRLIKVFERFRFIKLTAIVLALFIILTPFAPVFAQEAAPVPSTPTASPISTPSDPTAPATPTKETPTTAVPPDASVAPAPAAPTPSPSPFIETLNPINPAATSLIPSIDSNSGALNFTYPITIPSGRNKLAPDLKLSYSSQYRDPNNQFGYGWSINIPYIERIDKTGIANLYATNYYNSSLTGELNYISGSLYGSKIDNGEFLNYSLSGSGWVVYDKKGTKYTFGSAASSRQDNPLDSTKIYKWMLQEVRDTNNNYIAFNYYKDTGQIYPSSVVYTGNGTIGGIFEIDFLRQSRTDTSSSYKTGFLVKTNYRINEIDILVNLSWVKKYILSYATGRNGYNSLLQNITESGRDDLLNIATLPPTQFGYQNTTNPTWTENTSWTIPLNFVENGTCQKDNAVRVFDANGDGLPDIVQSYYDVYLGTTTHVYLNTGSGWTENTSWIVPVSFIQYNGTGCGVDLGVRIFDANGDGIMDLVQAAQVGDTSGVPIYAKHVYLGTGNGWVENSAWTAGIPTIFSNIDTRVPQNWDFQLVDVNGDGMIDWVESAQVGDISGVPIYEKHVYLNTGSGWSESAAWSSAIPVNFVENGSCQKEMGVRMFDVNGDGLADIVQSYFDVYSQIWTKHVYLNTGSTWVEDATWTASLPVHFMDYITCPGKDSGVRIFDANGDGLPDLVQAVQTGDTSGVPIYEKHVYLNTGNGWREDTAWRIPTIFVNNDSTRPQIWNFQTQDINGDGRVDLLESAQVGDISGVPLYEKHLFLGTGVQDDMLSQIIYNQGGTTSVIYKETPLYRTGSNTIANPNLPFELPAVYQIFNNSGSVTQTTTYQYDGGKYYYNTYLDRRLGGFADIVTTDSANNTKKNFYHTGTGTDASRGQYNDNGYKIDKIYRTEIANSTGTIYSKTINKWNDFDLGSGRRFVKLDQKLDLTYDGLATHKDKAEAYTYDNATGNILTKIEYGQVNGNDDGTFTDVGTDDFTTTYAYASNVSAFIVGLVDDVTVNDRSLNKIKEDRYYYDLQTLGGVTKGNQTKREMWKTGTTYVNIQKTYDGTYGLVTVDTDQRGKNTNYSYDTYNLYPATLTNPLTQQTSFTYNYQSGKVKQKTDPNTRVFQWVYDGLNRLTAEIQPDLTTPTTLVTKNSYVYTDTPGAVSIRKTSNLDTTITRDTYQYFDGLGQLIQQRIKAEGTNYEVTDKVYNNIGLLQKESLPYFSPGSSSTSPTTTTSLYINYTYDPMQRVVTTVDNLGTTTNTYNNWKLTVTDKNNKTKDLYKDAYGNLVQVDEHNGASTYSTYYVYDYLSDLTKITDALGNVRNFAYDGLGRRLTAQDLHDPADITFGNWTYTYDDAGNLTQKIDGNNNTIVYVYDDINRIQTEGLFGLPASVTYSYDAGIDGKGRLTGIITATLTQTNIYNPLGLVSNAAKTINAINYQTSYAYDRQGNQVLITNPDLSQIQYIYNSSGMVGKVQRKENTDLGFTDVVTSFQYSPTEQLTTTSYNNGALTTNFYDATKLYRLSSKVTTIAAASHAQDLSYTYDNVGNISQIVDASATDTSKTANYGYDDLYRLTSATITGVATGQTAYTENYGYSSIGNITSKTGQGNYSYDGNIGINYANPHAATSIGSSTLTYDNNGNMLTKSGALPWYSTGGTWTNRKQLTIDRTKVSGSTALTNFPVLVSVTDPSLKGTGSGGFVGKVDGTDILFTSSDGLTKLSHEIEKYDSITGNLIAWVKVPSLSNTIDTKLVIYYGNASATDQQNKVDVWSNSYGGIWHLPDGSTLTAKDSTANSPDGTISGPTAVAGQVDGAAQFGTLSTDKITTGYTAHNLTRTYEAWTYQTGNGGGLGGRVFDKRTTSPQVELIYQDNGTNTLQYNRDWSTTQGAWSIPRPSLNAWHHVVVTYDGNSLSNNPVIYLDGVSQTITTITAPVGTLSTNTDPYVIGNRGNDNARNWLGNLDEFRISNVIRSADWVATEYNNQNNPSTFMTLADVGGSTSVTNTWDYNNRLTQTVAGPATVTYDYDPTGQRIKYSNVTTTSYYPSKFYNTDGTTPTKHIFANGLEVAVVTGTGVSAIVRYIHTDHLTGSNIVTNSTNTKDEIEDYFPFGSIRFDQQPGSFSEQRKFTGHEYDVDTSLSYMDARYYDPVTGRFLSEDPAFLSLTSDLANPQAWNSYSYVKNNPLTNIDPDGRMSWSVVNNFLDGFNNAYYTNYALGIGRNQSNNGAYSIGQSFGDGVSFGQGMLEMAGGTLLDAGGITISGTGVGAVVGVPAIVAGIAVAGHGASLMGTSAYNFAKSLTGGDKNTDVYIGSKNGEDRYVGISKDVERRAAQHGDRFDNVTKVNDTPLTRNQARGVEQVIKESNPQFENKINSISPKNSIYQGAKDFANGLLKSIGWKK